MAKNQEDDKHGNGSGSSCQHQVHIALATPFSPEDENNKLTDYKLTSYQAQKSLSRVRDFLVFLAMPGDIAGHFGGMLSEGRRAVADAVIVLN
ncbi:hypothetical protein E2C01_023850 [Portunus trituberculatus]|uniref:Uncharacterized protein n=1 Tax=Portunus trituberculatus TaxID=210409 RepID=A0A5B7E987_PORTR|nr:hypothetical protein [Portunus trituberculatus]